MGQLEIQICSFVEKSKASVNKNIILVRPAWKFHNVAHSTMHVRCHQHILAFLDTTMPELQTMLLYRIIMNDSFIIYKNVLPVKDPFIVMRKLQFPPVPGIHPILLKSRVEIPAAEVPRAVLTIAVATAIPSPSLVILPY